MRSLRYKPNAGGLENLHYSTKEPAPDSSSLQPNEVIIKVTAAGLINTELGWPMHAGKDNSYPSFIVAPDYSGVISAKHPSVTRFSVGDAVMAASIEMNPETGLRRYTGGAAEFVVAPVHAVMRAPKNIPLRDAASIPLCAFTAWQSFHEQAGSHMFPGAKVLIAGAGGATGLWAVQVAKYMGAHVTATASDPTSIAMLLELGVDEVVNYREAKIEDGGRRFDLVLDVVGGKVFDQCEKVVKPAQEGGLLISLVVYEASTKVPNIIDAKFFIWEINLPQMEDMVGLIESGKLKPIIDSYYSLEQGRAAYEHAAKGHCHGKVILTLN